MTRELVLECNLDVAPGQDVQMTAHLPPEISVLRIDHATIHDAEHWQIVDARVGHYSMADEDKIWRGRAASALVTAINDRRLLINPLVAGHSHSYLMIIARPQMPGLRFHGELGGPTSPGDLDLVTDRAGVVYLSEGATVVPAGTRVVCLGNYAGNMLRVQFASGRVGLMHSKNFKLGRGPTP